MDAAADTALVLFSAGQDSATCLAWALDRYGRVETVGFDYGQRHAIELVQRPLALAALRANFPAWADRLGPDHVLDIRSFGAIADTALTSVGDFGLRADGLPNTFVPGRNLVFLTYAAAVAEMRGLRRLVTGVCETDYSGYPDCRSETIQAMAQALSLGIGRAFVIDTPLMHLTKAETWGLAQALGGGGLVDLIREETHTCYVGDRSQRHDWGYGCGACPACTLRAAGWAAYQAAR
jgi:7-cyano-7-deazaguanine synthase